MKHLLLALAILGIVVSASAQDPTNLAGGVFIAHHPAAMVYSSDPPPAGDWCAEYALNHAITVATDQVNRMDGALDNAMWYVLAAWTEDKEWCGTEFGFGAFDAGLYPLVDFGACFPATGGLEIPTGGWPGPNEGIAFVVTGDPWMGNYAPVYWFAGYVYGASYGTTVMGIDVDPPTGFAGCGNCENPPVKWDFDLGGMGINTDGIYVEPGEPPLPERVCCVEDVCQIVTEPICMDLGGVWYPDLTSCDPNPCIVIAVCCVEGECLLVSEDMCLQAGGDWYPDLFECDPNPCPAWAVCCVGEVCYILPEAECSAMGGVWFPDLFECDPNPCLVATDDASWGSIKALYR
jgi:hypothetical protein